MEKRIKGKCKYCGKEYTIGYMNKHFSSCPARLEQLTAESGKKKCGYFQLAIHPKYNKDYWLFIEIRDTATLKDLDTFLRDIWLECCGHLSAFYINGTSYEVMPDEDSFWGEPAKSMNYKLNTLLEKGMTIEYEYDFGSSTDLMITAVNYRVGYWNKEKLTILSRNNPHEYACSQCGKPATTVCTECLWNGDNPFLCDNCCETHECGQEMMLDVCNSPRMGVCGYCGSKIYPDQFTADTE